MLPKRALLAKAGKIRVGYQQKNAEIGDLGWNTWDFT